MGKKDDVFIFSGGKSDTKEKEIRTHNYSQKNDDWFMIKPDQMLKNLKRTYRILKERGFFINLLYTLVTFFGIIGVYIFFAMGMITNVSAFTVSMIFIGIRIAIHIVQRFDLLREKKEEFKAKTRKDLFDLKYLFLFEMVIIGWVCFMVLNLAFAFEFWYRIGIAELWVQDLVLTSSSTFLLLILLGVSKIFTSDTYSSRERREMKENYKELARRKGWLPSLSDTTIERLIVVGDHIFSFLLIGIFTLLLFGMIPLYVHIFASIWGGSPSTYMAVLEQPLGDIPEYFSFEGQAINYWFAYVFFILFMDMIPAVMIAFMSISSIVVIIAQSAGSVGRLSSQVAIGFIAVVPLLIVVMAMTGGIPAPPELSDVIGLPKPIASFVYGLGLILTFTLFVSVLAVFIGSTRALAGDFL